MPCTDCGVSTADINEYYMVSNKIWRAVTGTREDRRGYLCIGCLEKKLGRKLSSADFSPAPINRIGWLSSTESRGRRFYRKSKRLVERLGYEWKEYQEAFNKDD